MRPHLRPLVLPLAALQLTLPPIATAAEHATVLDNIVVTAEKRETDLQDTPIAISAYQGDYMRELELNEIQDVILQSPGTAFSRAGGEGQIYIRGVGTNLFGIGQDANVAVHQDGVYLSRAQMALNQFLDVERVEILRGPQGTLYGRNATAGVVNIISNRPTPELEGYASAYAGNFDRFDLQGAIGGPIVNNIGFRLAGRWMDDDGFTDDLEPAGGDVIDDNGFWATRGILSYAPSDRFDADLILEYSETDNNNRSVRRRDDLHTSQASVCADCPALPNAAFDETRNEMPTFLKQENLGLNLTFNWAITDNIVLTSITGYREFEDDFSFNTDGVEIFVTETQFKRDVDQVSQELRLASEGLDRWQWLVGVYLLNEDKKEALGLPSINFGGSFNIFATNEADSWAAFGELSYNVNDSLKLTAGLRYNDEEKDDAVVRGVNGGDFDGLRSDDPTSCAFFCGSRETKDSWDDWAPKFGIDYRIDDNTLLYGSITNGFKSGGTNSLDLNPSFDPEEIWSYEIGYKADMWDDRLRLNLAAFYYDYSDLQVSTFSQGTTLIENAASAEGLGFELDSSLLITEGLVWNVGLSLLNTEYKDFVTTFGSEVVDVSGNTLINAPEAKLITDLTYDWQLFGNTAFVFGQVAYQDDVFFSQFNEDVVGQSSYVLVNLRGGYRFGADENWELAVLVKNAFDEEYFQNGVRFTSLSDSGTDPERIGAALGYPGEGRSYGLQLRFSFD